MKKLMLGLTCALLFGSCIRIAVYRNSSALDYSKYATDNFFITESNSVSFAYEPKGSLSAIHLSGYELTKNAQSQLLDDAIGANRSVGLSTTNLFSTASNASVLQEMIKKAKILGGNGIINLKIEYIPSTKETYSGYAGTGMAIKK